MKAKGVLVNAVVFIGLLTAFGSVGRSDYESLHPALPQTPFWALFTVALIGIIVAVGGLWLAGHGKEG